MLPAGPKLPNRLQILIRKGQNQRAVPDKRDRKLPGRLLHQGVAFHIKAGLVRTGRSVKPRVDNGGIGLGGPHSHVLRLLQEDGFEPVAGKLPQNHSAGDAASDHCCIVSHNSPLPRKKEPQKTKGAWSFAFCDSITPHKIFCLRFHHSTAGKICQRRVFASCHPARQVV